MIKLLIGRYSSLSLNIYEFKFSSSHLTRLYFVTQKNIRELSLVFFFFFNFFRFIWFKSWVRRYDRHLGSFFWWGFSSKALNIFRIKLKRKECPVDFCLPERKCLILLKISEKKRQSKITSMWKGPLIHKFPLSLEIFNTTETVESELLMQFFLWCLYWRTCQGHPTRI